MRSNWPKVDNSFGLQKYYPHKLKEDVLKILNANQIKIFKSMIKRSKVTSILQRGYLSEFCVISSGRENGLQEYLILYFLKCYFGITRNALVRLKKKNDVLGFEFYRTKNNIIALQKVINISNREISENKSSIFDYIVEELENQKSEKIINY